MKLKYLVLSILVLTALSFAVYSLSKATRIDVTDDISLEKIEDCKTIYWNESQDIYGDCIHYYNATVCDDEPLNTSCHLDERSIKYTCQTGTETVQKSREVCNEKEMQATVDDQRTYRVSYDGWGKCSYATESDILVITCDSQYDGNNDGICTSGESCIQFRIGKDGTERLIKNSRDDFTETDQSFFLEKLTLEEVPE